MTKRLLFIAPLPPPTDGQSKASAEALKAFIELGWEIDILNIRRRHIKRTISTEILRIFDVFIYLYKSFKYSRKANSIYYSLSESYLGNIKDLLIYILLWGKIKYVTLHMLGGTGMDKLLNQNKFTSFINCFFMKKMNAVIVEGDRGRSIFKKYFSENKIKIINNFADDYLHSANDAVVVKFKNIEVLNILYLSNLLQGKGYMELFKGYVKLPLSIRQQMTLTFVGGFQDINNEQEFLSLIANETDIKYLGKFIDGAEKKELYLKSHIFCLPTYYPYEGQPISILEAYATGCAVITTNHAGIPDVFKDNVNGMLVKAMDSDDITRALTDLFYNKDKIQDFAFNNLLEAQTMYKTKIYRDKIKSIFIEK
jgi:glycosyltransferase involved in cell wall biosynthesis